MAEFAKLRICRIREFAAKLVNILNGLLFRRHACEKRTEKMAHVASCYLITLRVDFTQSVKQEEGVEIGSTNLTKGRRATRAMPAELHFDPPEKRAGPKFRPPPRRTAAGFSQAGMK